MGNTSVPPTTEGTHHIMQKRARNGSISPHCVHRQHDSFFLSSSTLNCATAPSGSMHDPASRVLASVLQLAAKRNMLGALSSCGSKSVKATATPVVRRSASMSSPFETFRGNRATMSGPLAVSLRLWSIVRDTKDYFCFLARNKYALPYCGALEGRECFACLCWWAGKSC